MEGAFPLRGHTKHSRAPSTKGVFCATGSRAPYKSIVQYQSNPKEDIVIMDPLGGAAAIRTVLPFHPESDYGVDREIRADDLDILQFRRF